MTHYLFKENEERGNESIGWLKNKAFEGFIESEIAKKCYETGSSTFKLEFEDKMGILPEKGEKNNYSCLENLYGKYK